MIGKIVAAVIGKNIGKQTRGMSGAGGAVAGVVTAGLIRRMSLPALIALAAGGYAAKKHLDKKNNGATA